MEKAEKFLDFLKLLDVDGMTVASAFQYLDAPDQEHFFGRKRTSALDNLVHSSECGYLLAV